MSRHRVEGRPLLAALLAGLLLGGCAGSIPAVGAHAPPSFRFARDTVAYANDLVWEYEPDASGHLTGRPRESTPDYSRYCFVVVRTARQFFGHARFEPDRPAPDVATLRALVHRVVRSSPRRISPETERVVVPGYPGLRALSRAHGDILKEEAGHWWQSYLQRGNWRMILPFPRWHQAWQVGELVHALDRGDPPIVHLVRFPSLAINHAVLLFGYDADDAEVRFRTYDPNRPDAPGELVYDRASRTFQMPANRYFEGGRVDAYWIYHNWIY